MGLGPAFLYAGGRQGPLTLQFLEPVIDLLRFGRGLRHDWLEHT